MNRYELTPNPRDPFGFTMEESDTDKWVSYEDVNKLRAQAVRDAVKNTYTHRMHGGVRIYHAQQSLLDYADKTERGEA